MGGYAKVRVFFVWMGLSVVEMTMHRGDRSVVEMPWHPGEMPLERVSSNTVDKGGMILPP